ncbi:serine/threonine-protein kinase [Georgenia halophila]|uniref:non-specific serine/threonine protein kinase n=1 Tax=Georgenia halophila TaxID=620889 RepID=A0ABP8LMP0_9MICO
MSPRRAPAQHPELPGYTFERLLGSGGFSDVYLYTQHMPRRKVAVKVLTKEATEGQPREQFIDEANLMAALSGHSSIVDLYHAGEAGDGRPFLVMQFCPLPNLAERIKVRPLGVAEAVSIGVRIAGALETAHRGGIVHRDIKPANVLTTEYGRPALADFGIAGLTSTMLEETTGVSIPWAPPEAVEGAAASGVAGDVYSLAATIYTLLAGRSPFSRPGGPNTRLDFTTRIRRDPVPPIGRGDVPASLERVLSRAMAKVPAQRYGSALDLARALQVVEQEMRLPMSDIELPDTSWLSGDAGPEGPGAPGAAGGGVEAGGDQRTMVRQVVEVDPHGGTSKGSRPYGAPAPRVPATTSAARGAPPHGGPPHGGPAHAGPDDEDRTALRGPTNVSAQVEATRLRGAAAPQPQLPDQYSNPDGRPKEERSSSRRGVVVAAVVVAAAVLTAVGVIFVAGELRGEPDDRPTATGGPTIALPDVVPAPVDLAGTRQGSTVTFTWAAPENLGDSGEVTFTWRRTEPGAPTDVIPADEPRVVIEDASGEVCLSVKIRLDNGRTSNEPAVTCVP